MPLLLADSPLLLGDSPLLLGEDLLAYLVLALGAALLVGNLLALARPPAGPRAGDLERAPVARTITMAAIGAVATLWAVASLLAA